MAVNAQKLLPPSKTAGAIVKSPVTMNAPKKTLGVIKVKIVDITKILNRSTKTDKKILNERKRDAGEERKEEQETQLESQVKDGKGKIPMIKNLPKMGFLDAIKNFIKNIILGYLTVRLIDHLPKLIPIVTALAKVGDFLIDTGIKLFDGLATFVDWGYKAYDATRGFIKQLGGENFAKNFDKFTGAVDTALFLTTVLAGSMAIEAMSGGGDGGLTDLIGDQLKRKGAQQAASNVAGQAGRTAGMSAGTVAAVIAGAGLLASALGEGAFQLRGVIEKPIKGTQKEFEKYSWLDPRKYLAGAANLGFRLLLEPFMALGTMLDIIGAPFRYAIELLRYPFLSEEDKIKQAKNLAKFDARIREDFRKGLNRLTLGFAFKEKGSFGNIYGNKDAQKEMMSKMAGGGITRGGKALGGVKRSIGGTKRKGRYKREVPKKPSKTQFDAKTNNDVKKSGEQLDQTKYFGPILAISAKIQANQEPTARDYENVGLGLNLLVAKGIEEGQLKGGLVAAFANGGMVDKDFLEAAEKGSDISGWVAKTFQGEIESNAQKTMRLIKERVEQQKQATKSEPGTTADPYTSGPAGTSGDALTMARNLMRDLGLTEAQAAGIVGNMVAESGVENARPQGSRPGTKGALVVDGVTGYGIVQWTSRGRQQALYDFAKSMGHDMSKPLTMDIEYKFFLKEFRGAYGSVLRQIKQAPDTKTASTIFMQQYEIPAGYRTNTKIMERYNLSKPIYDKLAAGQGTATDKPGSYIAASGIELGTGSVTDVDKFTSVASKYGLSLTSSYRPGDRGYHGKNRARDYSNDSVGNGTPQQLEFAKHLAKQYGSSLTQLIYTPLGFGIANGKRVGLDYWGDKTNSEHYHHVHVALGRGGKVRGLTKALLGERGVEFVIDSDSTRALEENFPGFLSALNKANYDGALQVLRNYAEYEQGGGGSEVVMVPVPVPTPLPIGGGHQGSVIMGSSGGAPNPISEFMYANS